MHNKGGTERAGVIVLREGVTNKGSYEKTNIVVFSLNLTKSNI